MGPAVIDPGNKGCWDHLSVRVIGIASLLPSFVVIIMSIHPSLVGLPLLLPCVKHLDISVDGHLLHAPMQMTDKEESFGTGLTLFEVLRKIKKTFIRHLLDVLNG